MSNEGSLIPRLIQNITWKYCKEETCWKQHKYMADNKWTSDLKVHLELGGYRLGMWHVWIFSLRIPSPFSWAAVFSTHCSLRLPEKHPRNSTPILCDIQDIYQIQHLFVKKRQWWRRQDEHHYWKKCPQLAYY